MPYVGEGPGHTTSRPVQAKPSWPVRVQDDAGLARRPPADLAELNVIDGHKHLLAVRSTVP
ncbi:hypothetical protein [Kibdelosporangium philippinense]|uniref:hypothetical protein n=1 Tax=Kibdelosporangium philippinense TaxID=211113 RepID=UPI00360C4934